MESRKANILYQVIMHVILIILVFGIFYIVISSRVNSRLVKQQVLEKQIALLIDSAEPGMNLTISRINMNGYISNIEIKQDRVFVYVNNLEFSNGYPYFTRYSVELNSDKDNYYIIIKE